MKPGVAGWWWWWELIDESRCVGRKRTRKILERVCDRRTVMIEGERAVLGMWQNGRKDRGKGGREREKQSRGGNSITSRRLE